MARQRPYLYDFVYLVFSFILKQIVGTKRDLLAPAITSTCLIFNLLDQNNNISKGFKAIFRKSVNTLESERNSY